ncbi:MAG TPA: hypothetical protein VL947_02170, partial [Cytophagales bacterium]|nr:hypothetical protein [Cytophagales bacterium]
MSKTLTIGRIIVNGGTFTAGSAGINITNSMSINGGTFTSTSGTLNIQGNFSLNSGTFNHNNGTFVFSTNLNTNGRIANVPGTLQFYNLHFNNNFSGTTQVSWNLDNFVVNNNLTITTGAGIGTRTNVFNNGTVSIYGSLILNGTSTYKTETTSGTATFRMLGSTPATITSNSTNYRYRRLPNLSIANTAGVSLSSGSLGVQNLLIESSGILTVTSDTIAVLGNFTTDGTFNANSGTIVFDCAIPLTQYLNGSKNNIFNNIVVYKNVTDEVLLGSNQRIKGKFFLRGTKSRFNTNGQTLTFLSTATGTASISRISPGSVFTGSVIFQRYIPARAGRYNYQLSSPVVGAQFWNIKTNATSAPPNPDNGVFITGWVINGHNPDIPSIGLKNTLAPSIKSLNANTGDAESPASINTTIESGLGYQVFVRDGSEALAPSTGAKILSFRGPIHSGTFNFNLGYSPTSGSSSNGPVGGWNFLGNPYPSDITADLSHAGWNTSSANLVDNTVYQYDADAKVFITCLNGVGSVGATGNDPSRACIISSSQGFQVRTTAPGTLTASESTKISVSTYGSGQGTLRISKLSNTLDIELGNKETGIKHGTLLRFLPEATSQKDADLDALNLRSEDPLISVSTVTDHTSYAINSLSEDFADTVGVNVSYPSGTNILSFDNNTLDGTYKMILKDKKLNIEQDVVKNPIYEFSSLNSGATYENRFVLNIRKISNEDQKSTAASNIVALYPNPSNDGRVTIRTFDNKSIDGIVNVMNVEGQLIYSQNISGQSLINLEKDLT